MPTRKPPTRICSWKDWSILLDPNRFVVDVAVVVAAVAVGGAGGVVDAAYFRW